jgi:pantetheine-phosphate adenylyltransferase
METIAIYPGTFDPITLGHMDLITRAAKSFPKLIVAVAGDTNKSTLFTLDERVNMAREEIDRVKPAESNIEVTAFNGLLVDLAKRKGAKVIIRGLRAASDFEYEFQMSYVNHKLAPELETMFIPATEKSHFIASRFVREIARLNGDLTGFASESVAQKLRHKYDNA